MLKKENFNNNIVKFKALSAKYNIELKTLERIYLSSAISNFPKEKIKKITNFNNYKDLFSLISSNKQDFEHMLSIFLSGKNVPIEAPVMIYFPDGSYYIFCNELYFYLCLFFKVNIKCVILQINAKDINFKK